MHNDKDEMGSDQHVSLDPEQIKLTDLITKEQALATIRGLRSVAIVEYRGDEILPLNDIYGVPIPDYFSKELSPLLEQIRDTQTGHAGITSDGLSMVGEPIFLSCDDRTYLKGCLAGIPPTILQSETDSNRGMLRLLTGMLSQIISAEYRHLRASYAQQAVEQELRLDRNRLAEVINNIGAGLLLVDKQMRITWYNSAAAELSDIADLSGHLCYQAIYGRDEACCDCPVLRAFATGQMQSGRFTSSNQGTNPRYYDLATTPIFDSKGNLSQVLELIYEVTDKQLAMEERDRFFRNVSHELRTPLTSVLGFAELLKDSEDILTPHQGRLIQRINDNAQKMLGLVNDLLDLSKIGAEQVTIRPSRVDLNKLITQVIDDLSPLAAEKHLNISFDKSVRSLYLTTDPAKVSHIITNLISNAIKFTAQGSVTISATKDGQYTRIDIQDTGVGIPADDLLLIFREFHQGIYQDKKHRGTGLGLSIAQKLAILLGGGITVQSEVGVGSTFTLSLPAKYSA